MAGRNGWLLGLALAAAPGMALAQTEPAKPAPAKPAPAPKPKPKTVESVVVTGGQPDVVNSIDRRSFTLGKDLTATTGSIADALRNLPSVEVDLQGNLSLRGDSNVTILVDGKPAPMFEGAGRADALQQLPADQYERVEVITNPSAALTPEGSGGVINLVTKKSRGGGRTGSAYVSAGTAGLKRAGATLGYNSPKLSVTASVSGNYQRNKNHGSDQRWTLDPASGRFADNISDFVGRNLTRGPTARLNLSYALTPKDQLSGSLQLSRLLVEGHPFNHFAQDDPDGTLLSLQNRQGSRRFGEDDASLTAGWKRSLPGEGHEISADIVANTSLQRDHTTWQTFQSVPASPFVFERVLDDGDTNHAELRLGYSQMFGRASLKTGYELKYDRDDFPYLDARGLTVAGLANVPSLANHFLYKQTVNAVFATWERPFGDLDVQAGLRVEDVRLDLRQLTSGEVHRPAYTRPYPTLHLAYKLDDKQKLTASYSERVQRPPSVFLNPLRYVIDPQNVQQGNAELKPAITRAYELGYEMKSGASDYLATLYYRRRANDFTPLVQDIGRGVFAQTFANLGRSQYAGLELALNGKLTSKLSYNASTNLYWREIEAGNLGFAGSRSEYAISGRANLNWQVRADDLVQFNVYVNGRGLTPQGVFEPNGSLNLGWRHKLTDRLNATVTVQDALGSVHFERNLDTPALIERFRVEPVARSVVVRLDYRFGGAAAKGPKDPAFDYGGGGGAGGGGPGGAGPP